MPVFSGAPIAKVIGASAAAPVGAYLGTIVIYLLNGIFFHCWIDPTNAATATATAAATWTCPMHLPDFVSTAIEGVVTFVTSLATGYFMPGATNQP